jgi:uncharacterized membrane protein
MDTLLNRFVANKGYKIDQKDLKLQHLSHPDHVSIRSITDTLDYFGINNLAVKVPLEALPKLPNEFLAFIETPEPVYCMVQKNGDRIKLSFEKQKSQSLSVADFGKVWPGNLIAIEEPELKTTSAADRNILLISVLSVLGLSLIGYAFVTNLLAGVLATTSLIGVMICYFINQAELGKQNRVGQMICSMGGAGNSCPAVIKSSSGKLLGIVSMADLSMGYFLSVLAITTILGFDSAFFGALALLTIPVLIYSVYTQAFVIRQWCALCLTTLAIIVIQDAAAFTSISFVFQPAFALKGVVIGAAVTVTAIIIKKFISEEVDSEYQRKTLMKLKKNTDIFDFMLERKVVNEACPTSFTFGSALPKVKLTTLISPFCGHCKNAYRQYSRLLKLFGEDIEVNLVFNVHTADMSAPMAKIAITVMHLYNKHGRDHAWKAMGDWFEDRSEEEWFSKYSVNESETAGYATLLEAQMEWCKAHGLAYTPLTIIDGKIFPMQYQLDDLFHFIPEIIDRSASVELISKELKPELV